MEADGRAKDIDALVDSLENLRWGSVDRIESKNIPVHGDYEFEIVWYKDMDLSPICLPNLKKREKKHIKLRKNKAGSAI